MRITLFHLLLVAFCFSLITNCKKEDNKPGTPDSTPTKKELISKLAKDGKTIFYCSHMMDVVEKVSDRIVLINEGVVVANGSFHELQQQQGNKSLEKIFAGLTANDSLTNAAEDLRNAFE